MAKSPPKPVTIPKNKAWDARNDAETLMAAKQIQADPARMKLASAHAAQQVKVISAVARMKPKAK